MDERGQARGKRIMPSTFDPSFGRSKRHVARLLLLDLKPIEGGVATALAQQLVVPSSLGDRAVFDDQDAIGVCDGMKPVRDDDGGAALAEVRDGVLHQALG